MSSDIKRSNCKLEIIDTSLREGMQSPLYDDVDKYNLSIEERIEIFKALMQYGVKMVEVFSPIVNQKEKESLGELMRVRDKFYSETKKYTNILAHVRCHPGDIYEAIGAGVDGLNIYMGTSEANRENGHGKRIDEIVQVARPLLAEVKKKYPKVRLRFSGEDAFRTPLSDLFVVYDEIVEYVERLGTPDTVGVARPREVEERVKALKERYPNIALEGHFHNDRGYSLMNSVTAVKSGMEYIQTSIMGLGERSGITSLTGLIFDLYLEDPKIVSNFNIDESYALNVLTASIIGIQVPTTEPVSLTNRTHSAGVHTSAMLKGQTAYEAHDLSSFGVNNYKLLLGPLSGKHIIHYYLTNVLNYVDVNEELASDIAAEFKNRCTDIKKGIKPVELLEEIMGEYKFSRLSKPVSHEENLSK